MNVMVRALLDTADLLLDASGDLVAAGPTVTAPASATVLTSTTASRCRGAAFALRSAVEGAVADCLAARRVPGAIHKGSMRIKFLWLRSCVDADTARRARAVWSRLCVGCHYHQYELGPTQDQVRVWRADAAAVIFLLAK